MANQFGLVTATCLLLVALASCNRSGNERYIPGAPLAREALTAAMESWRRGEERARLPAGKPRIELIDTQRKGRQLVRYEILGELSVEGGRRFDVRLHLADPEHVETVQYIVLGIDPLWVMQKRDYDLVTHWEMTMEEPDTTSSAREKPDE